MSCKKEDGDLRHQSLLVEGAALDRAREDVQVNQLSLGQSCFLPSNEHATVIIDCKTGVFDGLVLWERNVWEHPHWHDYSNERRDSGE